MRHNKKTIIATSILLVLILVLGYYFIKTSKNNESNKLKVTINSWVGFGPLFIADETGIFEENNLNIEIIKLEFAPDRRAALLSNRVQIVGSTLDDLAVTLSQGVDVAAFSCADYSNGGDAIIARKGIESLDTISNFSIAVQPGFVNHFFLLYVLKQNGLPIDNLKITPMTPDDAGAAFLAGNLDVAVTWQPHISVAQESDYGCNILASSKDYPEAILDLFIAKKEWINNNPNLVVAFRKSWNEALEFMEKNKSKSNLILSKQLGLSTEDIEAMLLDIRLLNNKEGLDLIIPKIDELSDNVESIWKEAGYVTNDIDIKGSIILK